MEDKSRKGIWEATLDEDPFPFKVNEEQRQRVITALGKELTADPWNKEIGEAYYSLSMDAPRSPGYAYPAFRKARLPKD